MVKVDCVEITQQYRIIRQIADGGFSDIFLGTSRHTNNPVAIKMVNLMKHSYSENTLKFLKNESNILSNLSHVNIIRLLDYFNSKNYIYLVLDYEDNDDLLEYLTRSKGLRNLEIINIYSAIIKASDNKLMTTSWLGYYLYSYIQYNRENESFKNYFAASYA